MITGCSDFSEEQESVIKEFLNTSFYGQKEGEFSQESFYSYVRLSFTIGEDNNLKYTYNGRAYASYMNSNYEESGDVKISYNEDGDDHIEIELLKESGDHFRTIDFVIKKDSIIEKLKKRTLNREIIRSFKDNRKIKQSYNCYAEQIEEMTSGSSRTVLSYLWNEDYKSIEYIGKIFFNENTGSLDLMEEYDESIIDRPSFFFNDKLEKNQILKFLKNGFEIYDTNIYDKKEILSLNEIYSSKPISPEENNWTYARVKYVNEFPGDDLKFLFDDTWDFGFTEWIGGTGYYRSRVVSMNDPSVKEKYVGFRERNEYNDYGFAYSTWYMDIMMKTSHENSEHNIIDTYKIFEIENKKDKKEKYLLLSRKYLTSPNESSTAGYGGYNNDYIILKSIK